MKKEEGKEMILLNAEKSCQSQGFYDFHHIFFSFLFFLSSPPTFHFFFISYRFRFLPFHLSAFFCVSFFILSSLRVFSPFRFTLHPQISSFSLFPFTFSISSPPSRPTLGLFLLRQNKGNEEHYNNNGKR